MAPCSSHVYLLRFTQAEGWFGGAGGPGSGPGAGSGGGGGEDVMEASISYCGRLVFTAKFPSSGHPRPRPRRERMEARVCRETQGKRMQHRHMLLLRASRLLDPIVSGWRTTSSGTLLDQAYG